MKHTADAEYCTTIAQYTPLPLTPPFVCHTPYNICNVNIV